MNPEVKEYIESGILETYVLGGLNAAECKEVEQMAILHAEIRDEIDAIERGLKTYSSAQAPATSSGLKDKIMSAIDNDGINVINIIEDGDGDPRNRYRWSIAASILLLLSMGLNIFLYNRLRNDEKGVVDANIRAHKADSVKKQVLTAYNQAMSDMAILKDPMYKMVELKGQAASPDSKAMVCWCPDSKLVYFAAEKMKDPPKGMQYQLWAIVNGKPVSEGMITMGNGLHKMKDVGDATAFAVTLEKEGGSDTPHGDMIVMGAI